MTQLDAAKAAMEDQEFVGRLLTMEAPENVQNAFREKGVDLSLVGQNLLGGPNRGFTPELLPMTPTQADRVAYGRLTLRF